MIMCRAVLWSALIGMGMSLAFGPAAAAPQVVQIDPVSPSLPENVLRMHIQFSDPMREGYISKYIRVIDVETGAEVEQAFFDSFYELWTPDHRRLTLLVDPGRVKTGLEAHDTLGRAFVAGRDVRIEVSSDWPTLSGDTLAGTFAQSFTVTPEERSAMDPSTWDVSFDHGVVRLSFDRVIDIHSLNAHVRVLDNTDTPIGSDWALDETGQVALSTIETSAVPHRLVIRHRFEDVAGNTVTAAFDHQKGDVEAAQERAISFLPIP